VRLAPKTLCEIEARRVEGFQFEAISFELLTDPGQIDVTILAGFKLPSCFRRIRGQNWPGITRINAIGRDGKFSNGIHSVSDVRTEIGVVGARAGESYDSKRSRKYSEPEWVTDTARSLHDAKR